MKHAISMGLAGGLVAFGAVAEPITTKAARDILIVTDKTAVLVMPKSYLSDSDVQILTQVAAQQKFYAAVAASPSEGLMSEALVAAANYHTLDPARAVALASCNDRKRSGSEDCEIVAEVVPKGWTVTLSLQLNADATEEFRRPFRRKRGEKAFAISLLTGNWAVAYGAGAAAQAVAGCNASGEGTDDCAVVIAD